MRRSARLHRQVLHLNFLVLQRIFPVLQMHFLVLQTIFEVLRASWQVLQPHRSLLRVILSVARLRNAKLQASGHEPTTRGRQSTTRIC